MFPDLPGVVNTFKLRGEAGDVYSDDLELVFAELSKFDQPENALGTLLDKWFYFLKHARDLSAIPPPLSNEPAIAHAFAIANKANMTAEELEAQDKREIFIQDQRGALALAEEKGLEKGREEGVIAVARQLLTVLDDATIAEKTGLTETVVAQLRKEAAGWFAGCRGGFYLSRRDNGGYHGGEMLVF